MRSCQAIPDVAPYPTDPTPDQFELLRLEADQKAEGGAADFFAIMPTVEALQASIAMALAGRPGEEFRHADGAYGWIDHDPFAAAGYFTTEEGRTADCVIVHGIPYRLKAGEALMGPTDAPGADVYTGGY